VGRELGPDGLVVVLIPDSGRGYLSRVFDDEWMAGYGFPLGETRAGAGAEAEARAGPGVTVADLLGTRHSGVPPLVYARPEDTVRRVVNVMRGYGVSQVPVAKGDMPLAAAEVLGSADELALMDLVVRSPSAIDDPIEKVMGPPLPTIGIGQPLDLAVEILDRAPALVVLAGGRPHAVLTRTDVLDHLSSQGGLS
jgi:cystathionine beta-synthase